MLCVKENCPWSVEAVIVLQTLFLKGKIMSGKPKAGRHKDTTKDLQCAEYKPNNMIDYILLMANNIHSTLKRALLSRQLCWIASLFIICQESNKR